MRLKRNRPRAYAFIDSQNLNLGVQKVGWKMDWRRFRQYLFDEYNVVNAYMFIGYMQEHEDIYEYMHSLGFLVVLKPTVDLNAFAANDTGNQKKSGDGQGKGDERNKHTTKGNVDADLVLYAMKELPNYDKAVIVSGDGDFYGLIEYLEGKKKLGKILAPNRQYSSLLKPFEKYIVRLDGMKQQLRYYDRKR